MRLCLLLLVSIMPSLAAFADDAIREGSIFLVARKDLPDPFFRDSVVLVTHRAGPVPVGVIINRPTGIALSRVVPGLDKLPVQEAKVFFGGPVNPEGLLVVFRDVIILGATAPSFLKGLGYDREVSKRITDGTGKPATTTSTALLEALKTLGISRIALGSAYSPAVNDICAKFIEANGIKVVAKDGLNVIDNLLMGSPQRS